MKQPHLYDLDLVFGEKIGVGSGEGKVFYNRNGGDCLVDLSLCAIRSGMAR